jgi:hypothetical protein
MNVIKKRSAIAKKRKPKKSASDELTRAMIEGGEGAGTSADFADNFLWLHDEMDEHTPDWVVALERLDAFGDKKPLTDLLRSERVLPLRARHYLADLIERGVKRPMGRRRTPAYNMSPTELDLWFACRDVGDLVREGLSVAVALAKVVARRPSINPTKLENAYNQRRGNTRRMALRRRSALK